MRLLFTLTIFLGSALLFLVEPMVAKMILPRFGGAPAVWTASMVFFQMALLAGYACADIGVKWLGPKRQSVVHALIFLAGLVLLPVALPAWANLGSGEMPALKVIAVLAVMVGLPFLVLSAGAPLLQRWFATTGDPLANDPYFLYSASNLGSMLALLAYPLLIEPRLGLAQQAHLWTIGYGITGLLLVAVAWVLPGGVARATENASTAVEKIQWGRRLKWIGLAAVPSSLLLGATTHITTAIAPVPLLWVEPLALYLLSFIFAFARHKVPTTPLVWVALFLIAPVSVILMMGLSLHIELQLTLHLLALFALCWACHQTLADDRPDASHLTEFFFFLALGGMLGGVFNSIVAPVAFKSLAEYPIALCAAALLLPRGRSATKRIWIDALAVVVVLGLSYILVRLDISQGWGFRQEKMLLVAGLPVLLACAVIWRRIGYGLCLAGLFLLTRLSGVGAQNLLDSDRSFFGVHDVFAYGPEHHLQHGTTLHGLQNMNDRFRPVTYYSRKGPVGELMADKMSGGKTPAVAVVGLGAGTMAAYGQPHQALDFYEIDPTVIAMAENPRYFTYLSDCKADWKVIEGDARLSLAKAPDGKYGVIVLDAFTSDAIPLHLLTREAIQIYVRKLAPDGVIAFHISNRFLDLRPILANAAKDQGLQVISSHGFNLFTSEPYQYRALYLLMARNTEAFGELAKTWEVPKPLAAEPVWTDDYSSVLQALTRGGV